MLCITHRMQSLVTLFQINLLKVDFRFKSYNLSYACVYAVPNTDLERTQAEFHEIFKCYSYKLPSKDLEQTHSFIVYIISQSFEYLLHKTNFAKLNVRFNIWENEPTTTQRQRCLNKNHLVFRPNILKFPIRFFVNLLHQKFISFI